MSFTIVGLEAFTAIGSGYKALLSLFFLSSINQQSIDAQFT